MIPESKLVYIVTVKSRKVDDSHNINEHFCARNILSLSDLFAYIGKPAINS
jgi:hypothetical protein